MKKSLLALAVLGTVAGTASAQSSVTLSGTVDASGQYIHNSGADRRFNLGSSGLNSSQLVFAGTEDLGGGLRAGFELNAGLGNDTGAAGTSGLGGSNGSQFFSRRSVVYIAGRFGELRLGREYAPSFWNLTTFDAFGTNGLGDSTNTQDGRLYTGTRRSNAINYYLPKSLGGVYGQLTTAASENGTEQDRPGRYLGGRLGYAAGPLNVAISAADQRFDRRVNQCQLSSQRSYNVGASYDFGIVKLLGYYDHEKCDQAKDQLASISAVIPFGQSEVHVGYDYNHYKQNNQGSNVQMAKASYVYNLSKRTALYTTFAYLDNMSNRSTVSLRGGNPIDAGGKSKGGEFGIRHFF